MAALDTDALRAEFLGHCEATPQLAPLLTLFDLEKNGTLNNTSLFSLLYQLMHSDPELSDAYHKQVDNQADSAAKVFVSEHPIKLSHIDLLHKSSDYAKTGRIYAPPSAQWADKLPTHSSSIFEEFIHLFENNASTFSQVMEGDGKPMRHSPQTQFTNWGLTVCNMPTDTFAARTRVGVQNLVKWAAKPSINRKVRCAGFRHTWSDLYSENNEIIVMLLPLEVSTNLHVWDWNGDPSSDLQGITLHEDGHGGATATIAAGTTNDQFRQFCLANKKWCVPFNVIMIEITFGGSNAPICHGAGLSTTTLSDLVVGIEYVDSNGNIQSVTDPDLLRAASGCFGLLGVVISVTLRLDKMQVAVLQPVKQPIMLAIPPPPDFKMPDALKADYAKYTPAQLQLALKDFIARVENDYYLEWFWFPYQDKVWTNTWSKAELTTQSLEPYPSGFQAALQWLEGYMGQILTNWWAFQTLPARLQAWFLGTVTLLQMPNIDQPKDAVHTYVSEALHFRRGIQNMRVRDSEWEIPFPAIPGGKTRDYTIIQRAWWDAIGAFYSSDSPAMRLTLEMRITGGSNVIMAPQRGNSLGTISIEVLTPLSTSPSDWAAFKQQVASLWTNYRDEGGKGKLLKARPHWAKEWQNLIIQGVPIIQYFRDNVYADERKEFLQVLEKTAKKNGSTLEESKERFGNPLLQALYFD